ncbi:radical SAM protein [candidate division KSB1 bacterium]|nr:radical SAM protein [candidate division KSB1 bacterium]RQV93931.1 MAG: radical SAM protein [bacterium]
MSTRVRTFYQYANRLLAGERSRLTIKKEAPLRIALVYPNSYEVGMANLGFQSVYRLFNEHPLVMCERAFYDPSLEETVRSIESGQLVTQFDVIAFSVSFEMDFFNMLKFLQQAGLSLRAADRHVRDPLVIAGGVATFINPLPIAPFIDLFFLGEIESQMHTLIDGLLSWKSAAIDKNEVVASLSKAPGFYSSLVKDRDRVVIAHAGKQDNGEVLQYSPIVTSYSHFKDTFLIEVGRGCYRRCRFCAASHIYQPVRFFPLEVILSTIDKHIQGTRKIGLVGAALCDYPEIVQLGRDLVTGGYELGLSSYRFETISESFLDVLNTGGVKTITLAPEAGSFELRKRINKPIPDELIYDSIELIAKSNIKNLKLYYLVGLPGETAADIDAMINAVRKIKSIFYSGNKPGRELTISTNAFIPKPFTPFQWCGLADEAYLKENRRYIERQLKSIGMIRMTQRSVKSEVLQAMLSLGNHTIADVLETSVLTNDLNYLYDSNEGRSAIHQKAEDESLSWDFIDYPVGKKQLWKQYTASFSQSKKSRAPR